MKEEASGKTSNKNGLRIGIFVLVVLAGLVILYWLISRQSVPPTVPSPPIQPVSPAVVEEPTKGWQVYTGLGLTVKYPSDWKVVAEEDNLVTLTDLPGEGTMTVRVEQELNLAELLEEKTPEEIILAGWPAMRTEVEEGEEEVKQAIFVEKGEVIYEINLRADKNLRKKYRDLFNLILATFQFTE